MPMVYDTVNERWYSEVPAVVTELPRPVSDGHVRACLEEEKLVRSFDRRGGYPSGSKPVGELKPPPPNVTSSATRLCWPEIDWDAVDANAAAVAARRKEDDLSLGLDCMCKNNDPNCAECWEPEDPEVTDPDQWLSAPAAAAKNIEKAKQAAGICHEGSFERMHNPYVGSPYIGDVARSCPVGVATSGTGGAITLSTTAPVSSEFERDVRNRFDECLELLLRKHSDYGPANIANAPGGALNGLRVRMHDKISRINNLIDKGVDPQNESLRDSFVDLANYSIIALLCIDGAWPSE